MRFLNLLFPLLVFSSVAYGQLTDDAVPATEDVPVPFNPTTNDGVFLPIPNSVDLNTSLLGRQTSITTAEGTYVVTDSPADGDVTFTPNPNFNGTSTIEYAMNYGLLGLFVGTGFITVTVDPVEDPPVAVDDLGIAATEDVPAIYNVVANDTDPDNNINPATVVALGGSGGTYAATSSGEIIYTPTPNFNGVATASYTVSDFGGSTPSAAVISFVVAAENDFPVAQNNSANTTENTAVIIDVLANDSDVDGTLDPATVSVTGGTNGTYFANPDGTVTYTPTPGYSGPATANYTVKDNESGTSNIATISIVVTAVDDPPVAVADGASMGEDATPITINILTNDTDDGTINPGTVVLSSPVNGIFSVSGTGVVTYTPPLNFNGVATVQYTVRDNGNNLSNVATVTVTVTAVDDAPVAGPLSESTDEDVAKTFSGIANASDVDGTIDPTSVAITAQTNGTFVANGAGVITFTPTPGFNGTATASYTVKDNGGNTSNLSSITVTVGAVNDPPVAVNDVNSTPATEDGPPITISILSNDSDPDGALDPASVVLTAPVNGTFTVNTAGVVTYTPPLNFNGIATVKYTVKDNSGAVSNEATVTVTVSPVNDAPVATNITASTAENTATTVNAAGNATDIDGTIDPATVVITGATTGTFVANAAGVVTFTPAPGFNGSATANYTIKDNLGLVSNSATITINVSSINDAPVALNDNVGMTEDAEPLAITILGNDSDPDGTINPATVILSTPVNGTFTVAATGIVTYTPVANFNGVASVKYTVKDNDGLISNVATVTVTVAADNDDPTFAVIPDQRVLKNSSNTAITITGISPGPNESETLIVGATSSNSTIMPNPVITYNGTATTATLTFKPNANQFGTVVITVTATDPANNVFTRTFQIDVVDVKFISTPVTLAVPDQLYEYFIEITDVTETLTIIATQKPAWATVTATGKNKAKLSGVPPVNAPLNTQVTLQLKDGSTILDQQVFTIIVNRPPLITSYALQTQEDTPLAFTPANFQGHYTDPDTQPLAEIQFTKLPKHGTLKLNGANMSAGDKVAITSIANVSYIPVQDYNGLDTLYWKASDSYSFSQSEAFVNYVVTPVNDPPVIESLEDVALQYELGSEIPVKITQTAHVYDVDNANLTGAEIRFSFPTYQVEKELLIYKDTLGIVGTFNVAPGILVLTGKAPVKDYEAAIRSIKFNYINLEEVKLGTSVINYTLLDEAAIPGQSETKTRTIDLIYTFKDLFIPTAFTPGGNDVNETWVITSPNTTDGSVPFDDAKIRVFTKSGVMVFETTGFDNPWDGTFAGKDLPVDTYYYTIDLKYNKIRYRGVVTILR